MLRGIGHPSKPEPLTWRRRIWLLFRALAMIVFGIFLLLLTRITLFLFIAAFGTLALVDGIASVVAGFNRRQHDPRWWLVALGGIVGIVIAGLAFFASGWTKMTLIYIFAIWAIIVGITQMLAFFRTRRLRTDWAALLPAVFSLLVGAYLLFKPSPNIINDFRLIALYTIVFGILTLTQAFQIRRQAPALEQAPAPHQDMRRW
ncbi:HdeD family acid-resistance protein [Ktedonospora formicarum]|nr:HdeD family acid-resistance protein [Ktedonospora formicarum]